MHCNISKFRDVEDRAFPPFSSGGCRYFFVVVGLEWKFFSGYKNKNGVRQYRLYIYIDPGGGAHNPALASYHAQAFTNGKRRWTPAPAKCTTWTTSTFPQWEELITTFSYEHMYVLVQRFWLYLGEIESEYINGHYIQSANLSPIHQPIDYSTNQVTTPHRSVHVERINHSCGYSQCCMPLASGQEVPHWLQKV